MDDYTNEDAEMTLKTIFNKDALERAEKCGCYYCLNEFDYEEEINEFEGEAAICPVCESDTLLPLNFETPIERIGLRVMHEKILNEIQFYGEKRGL